ncbi:Zinc finger A20 and AN1 domain-containing stress-associated protein 9 [Thelohanellus kitauei]|uniref:Zinc finger A20 and AN1 domain-containing stress-associated protein 9 n=1 Tax=Thelohanellus kitauei TaxID=669202 RepID=A0A0C2JVF2_THEKT|nr:Zinc finger A20 and AN1 domain-containing stress-associated protein 9 [Thelohanellus kitauei]
MIKMMERNPKKIEGPPSAPKLCVMNCGFYADPLYDGLCVKCHEKRGPADEYFGSTIGGSRLSHYGNMTCRSAASSISPSLERQAIILGHEECNETAYSCENQEFSECFSNYTYENVDTSASCVTEDTEMEKDPECHHEEKKEKPQKPDDPQDICHDCGKKILTSIKCKCDHYYCFTHRLPENHHCTFDFKKSGREKLDKENPVIVSEKIRKF